MKLHVISGGQTGVDIAALRAAKAVGFTDGRLDAEGLSDARRSAARVRSALRHAGDRERELSKAH